MLQPAQKNELREFWVEVNEAWIRARSDNEPDPVQLHRWMLTTLHFLMLAEGVEPQVPVS